MRLRRILAATATIALISTGSAVANAEDTTPTTTTDVVVIQDDTTPAEPTPADPTPADPSPTQPADEDLSSQLSNMEEGDTIEQIGSITTERVEMFNAVIAIISTVVTALVGLFTAFPQLIAAFNL